MLYNEQSAQLSLYIESEKNRMEVQKKQMLEDIATASRVQRAEECADIASKREFQRTLISFSAEGEVILQKEQFGKNINGKLPVKVLAAKLFAHLDSVEADVLSIIFRKENGRECCLFWNLQNLDMNRVRIPFEKNGIAFGFGEKKENEIRRKFLLAMINVAETMVLPEKHGWYQLNGKWKYAFPEEITWKEMSENC